MRLASKSTAIVALTIVFSMLVPVPGADSRTAEDGRRTTLIADVEFMKNININGFEFDPLQSIPDLSEGLRLNPVKTLGLAYYIVQFDGPIKRSMKDDLSRTGATILSYVNYNAFVVRANSTTIERAESLPEVRWAGLFEPAYKLSPRLAPSFDRLFDDSLRESNQDILEADQNDLLDDMLSDTTWTPGGSLLPYKSGEVISVEIFAFEEWNLPLVLDSIARIGGKGIRYSHQASGVIRAEMDRSSLTEVAREIGVMWIDRYVPYVFYNDIARWVVQSGNMIKHAVSVHEHGIWGTGQVVTVADTGIDYEHNAFEDPEVTVPGPTHRKVTDYYVPTGAGGDDSDQGDNHGTHTSATVAGDDGVWHVYDGDFIGSNGTYGPHDGIAFDATIQVQDLSSGDGPSPPSDFHDMYQEALDRGSWIHSNSWGSTGATYTTPSAQTDDFIWDNQDFLVVFAAGNDGISIGGLNGLATSKNVIAVGATHNGVSMEDVAFFSSRGPSGDGRLKPDVMAPGVGTWSALGGDPYGETDEYIQHSGTSMATPTVAGSCALVRQYYMDGWYPTGSAQSANAFTPSAALIKATVINSAAEMTGYGAYSMDETWYPNNNQGWGRVTIDEALYFLGDPRGLMTHDERVGLSTGETGTYQITVGDPSMPLEITLVWSDYPGSVFSSPNLVNDLDLAVRAPDGTVYLGNQYEGYNPGESVKDATEYDRLNNVEGVLVLTDPQVGVWTIEVTAFNTPVGPQPYALVVTGGIVTDRGTITMDRPCYQSDNTVTIRVSDTDLNLDTESADTSVVLLSSTTEETPESITIVETGDSTSVFEAIVALDLSASQVSGDGFLQVQNRDVINASYYDEDDGAGGSGRVIDFACVDDDPPVISGMAATSVRARTCEIEWSTDEPGDSTVWYGTEAPPDLFLSSASLTVDHVMLLTRLTDNETYYFAVGSTDEAGNFAYSNNASDYYTFRTPAIPPTEPPDREWPTAQNNFARLGSSPSNLTPPLELMWTAGSSEFGHLSSPILSEGILVSATQDGWLKARNPYTGEILWAEMTDVQNPSTSGTPTALDGVVYTCFSDKYQSHWVFANDIHSGELIWSVDLGSLGIDLASLPNLACDDGLILGGGRSSVFALNIDDGALIWKQTEVSATRGVSVANGLVYSASYDQKVVYAIDEHTGEIVWDSNLSSNAVGPPCITGDIIYVLTNSGILHAIDAVDGEVIWSTSSLGTMGHGVPTSDGDALYVSSMEGITYAIDALDGSIIWQTITYDIGMNTMACANGYLYRTSYSHSLFVHDTADGAILHEYPLEHSSVSSPAVSEGWVWTIDFKGDMYGFRGLLPIGLQVTPSYQILRASPDSTVRFDVVVENVGQLGEDTFDIAIASGVGAWETAVYAADGETPLEDTDGDLMIDTGPLQPYENATVMVAVVVPAEAIGGDSDIAALKISSSSDTNISMNVTLETLVPLPGTSIGPSTYSAAHPGESIVAIMEVCNDGGLPDIIDITTASYNGWNVSLFAADGSTVLSDTDGDLVPDLGLVHGQTATMIVVKLAVPADAQTGAYDRATITARSSADPSASSWTSIVAELLDVPSSEWPTMSHDVGRTGISSVDFELPLTHEWSAGPYYADSGHSSPVISDRIVYFADTQGYLSAVDLSSGESIWRIRLGKDGYDTGTPSVAGGLVHCTFTNYLYEPVIYAVDQYTGELCWSYGPGIGYADTHLCAPAVALGNVYWTDSVTGTLYANDALTGELLWTSLSGLDELGMGPTYRAGIVFVAGPKSGVTAVDAVTGDTLWTRRDLDTYAAPLVSDGILYTEDDTGHAWAVDAFDGTTIWNTPLDGYGQSCSPLIADGRLFVGTLCSDFTVGSMHALDALTGDILWTESKEWRWQLSSPAYSNGIVYATSGDGFLNAWNATTGDVLLTYDVGLVSYYSSVALGDGYLIIALQSGYVEAYGFKNLGVSASTIASPDPLVLHVGEDGIVEAAIVDIFGNLVEEGAVFEWESLSGLGTIDPVTDERDMVIYTAGTVAGNDTLQYTSGPFTGTIGVEIRPGSAARMTIYPANVNLTAGETRQFSTVVFDEFGNEHDDADIVWSASTSAGTIDANGSLVGSTKVGMGIVLAQFEGVWASATVTILPGELSAISTYPSSAILIVGATMTIEAYTKDAFGNAVPGVILNWSSDAGTVLPSGDDNGWAILVAPTQPGTLVVTVSANDLETNLTVQVVAGALNRIALSPNSIAIRPGESVVIQASWEDMYGNDLDVYPMEWGHSIGNLTVSSDGLSAELQAGSSPGQGIVTASYSSLTGLVPVTVLKSSSLTSGEVILIGAIIVAAVAVVLVVYLVRGRRKGPMATDIRPTVEQPPPP